MAFRLYVIPAIGDGSSFDERRPNYIGRMPDIPGEWWDYGFQPVFLAGVDLDAATDASLVANADVVAFPFNLDTNITGGTVNQFKNALEATFIPADWITGGMGWRTIAKSLAGMFRYMRRLNGVIGNQILFDGTANKTLNTQWGSIPASTQNGILAAAAIDNFSTAFITPTTQVRALLKDLADQSSAMQFTFGPFSL